MNAHHRLMTLRALCEQREALFRELKAPGLYLDGWQTGVADAYAEVMHLIDGCASESLDAPLLRPVPTNE
ncbi:hypothetical protein [Phenylobacterium sp.]|jgi:hypothetical protein|uniref:hypothetical protein n=1 Tax=Phenylobacterium sp. TaxID=1871053 RepID=UPI002F4019D4